MPHPATASIARATGATGAARTAGAWPSDLQPKPWRGAERFAVRVFRAVAQSVHQGPPVSRRDIVAESGMSAATVSKAVADLMDRRMLVDGEREPTGPGRPTVPVLIDITYWVTLGIKIVDEDHRPSRLVGVAADLAGNVLFQESEDIVRYEYRTMLEEQVVAQISALCRQLEDRCALEGRHVLGLGVELGGHIDDGRVIFSVNNGIGPERYVEEDGAGWATTCDIRPEARKPSARMRGNGRPVHGPDDPFDLQSDVAWATRHPTVVCNDVNALALADAMYGRTREQSNLTIAIFDEGIGGALVIDGHVFTGGFGAAADIGHIRVGMRPHSEAQKKCRCGGKQHVECFSTPLAITKELDCDWDSAIRRDDGRAINTFRRAGKAVGFAVASVMTVVNPCEVVIYVPPGLEDGDDNAAATAFRAALKLRCEVDAFSSTSEVPIVFRPLSKKQAEIDGATAAATAVLDKYLTELAARGA